jgi:hypothetical protein
MAPADLRRRLLAAVSIPSLIFAGLLAWQAYSAMTGRGPSLPPWRIYLHFAAALVLMVLFFAGLRARHRRPPDDPGDGPPGR